jgi:hypothetical protein
LSEKKTGISVRVIAKLDCYLSKRKRKLGAPHVSWWLLWLVSGSVGSSLVWFQTVSQSIMVFGICCSIASFDLVLYLGCCSFVLVGRLAFGDEG